MTLEKGTTPLWEAIPSPTAAIAHTWRPQSVADLRALRQEVRTLLIDSEVGTTPLEWEFAERLILALDELASNGLRHGSPPVTVELCNHPDGLLVIVSDAAIDRLPTPATDRPAGQGGYGLHLIADLAVAHGANRDEHAKHVWALLPRS